MCARTWIRAPTLSTNDTKYTLIKEEEEEEERREATCGHPDLSEISTIKTGVKNLQLVKC